MRQITRKQFQDAIEAGLVATDGAGDNPQVRGYGPDATERVRAIGRTAKQTLVGRSGDRACGCPNTAADTWTEPFSLVFATEFDNKLFPVVGWSDEAVDVV